MSRFISKQVQQMRPSGIRRYFEIASTMQDVVTLGIGEPNFTTPAHIVQAGVDSALNGLTGYTANAGLLELRQAIASKIKDHYAVSYDAETDILITVGASEAIFLALKAILDPGDEVLVIEPCFVANAATVEIAGGVPVSVHTSVETHFQVTTAQLQAKLSPRTKAILMSYPNNPTGAVLDDQHLQQIANFAEAHDLLVISDEIYEHLIYGHQHRNFASLPGMQARSIIISGMSKSYAMTGWRIGYVTAPEELTAAMKKIHQYLIMSAPTMGQMAALQALCCGEEDVETMRQSYDQRRRFIFQAFNEMGMRCFEPKGAFYAFPSITHTGLSDEEFCEQLLNESRVALIPGSAFGKSGAGFIRASYALSLDQIELAMERLYTFMQRNHYLNPIETVV
ncbi:aminotransferase class I/II-fold pyridoxal phosphate-dependent enzyme [Anaerolineales bacterium]